MVQRAQICQLVSVSVSCCDLSSRTGHPSRMLIVGSAGENCESASGCCGGAQCGSRLPPAPLAPCRNGAEAVRILVHTRPAAAACRPAAAGGSPPRRSARQPSRLGSTLPTATRRRAEEPRRGRGAPRGAPGRGGGERPKGGAQGQGGGGASPGRTAAPTGTGGCPRGRELLCEEGSPVPRAVADG